MSPDRLVAMANQIGAFFATQDPAHAVDGITDHLEKFWDPRMRTTIIAYVESGGTGLDAPVLDAVRRLAEAARSKLDAAQP